MFSIISIEESSLGLKIGGLKIGGNPKFAAEQLASCHTYLRLNIIFHINGFDQKMQDNIYDLFKPFLKEFGRINTFEDSLFHYRLCSCWRSGVRHIDTFLNPLKTEIIPIVNSCREYKFEIGTKGFKESALLISDFLRAPTILRSHIAIFDIEADKVLYFGSKTLIELGLIRRRPIDFIIEPPIDSIIGWLHHTEGGKRRERFLHIDQRFRTLSTRDLKREPPERGYSKPNENEYNVNAYIELISRLEEVLFENNFKLLSLFSLFQNLILLLINSINAIRFGKNQI